MSAKRKAQVDIEGLSTYMRNGFILIGLLTIASYYVVKGIGSEEIAGLVMAGTITVGTIFMAIRAQKFDGAKAK